MDANQRAFDKLQKMPSSIDSECTIDIYHLTHLGKPARAARIIANQEQKVLTADFYVIPYIDLESDSREIKFQSALLNTEQRQYPLHKVRELEARMMLDYEGIGIEQTLGVGRPGNTIDTCGKAYLSEFVKANKTMLENELAMPFRAITNAKRAYFPCSLGYETARALNPQKYGNIVFDPERVEYPGQEVFYALKNPKKRETAKVLPFRKN